MENHRRYVMGGVLLLWNGANLVLSLVAASAFALFHAGLATLDSSSRLRRLHLSEGSVASRIHVANVSIRFPQLLVALAENRISLTVAGLLAPHLSEDHVETLLADCAGMTKKAVLEYLVRIEPKPVFEPSIRRRPARPVPVEAAPAERPAAPPRELTMSTRQLSPSSPNIFQPARPTVFNFRFSADRSFKERFERLAEVMGVENAQRHMAER